MADLNFLEPFGLKIDKKPEKDLPLVLLLRAIIGMLSQEEDEDSKFRDEREQIQRELHVRPRIEPLGGA